MRVKPQHRVSVTTTISHAPSHGEPFIKQANSNPYSLEAAHLADARRAIAAGKPYRPQPTKKLRRI